MNFLKLYIISIIVSVILVVIAVTALAIVIKFTSNREEVEEHVKESNKQLGAESIIFIVLLLVPFINIFLSTGAMIVSIRHILNNKI